MVRCKPWLGLLVVVGCTFGAPPEESASPTQTDAPAKTSPTEAEAPTPAVGEPLVPDEDLPEGVTRRITIKPDGTEHIDVNVDLSKYDTSKAMVDPVFGVEEMKAALLPGTVLHFKVTGDVAKPGTIRWTFTEATEQELAITYDHVLPSGEVKRLTDERVPWERLNMHASFPRSFAQVSEAEVRLEAGRFQAWIFEMRMPGTGQVERFTFARSVPGPPVMHQVLEDGVEIRRMELVQLQRGQ